MIIENCKVGKVNKDGEHFLVFNIPTPNGQSLFRAKDLLAKSGTADIYIVRQIEPKTAEFIPDTSEWVIKVPRVQAEHSKSNLLIEHAWHQVIQHEDVDILISDKISVLKMPMYGRDLFDVKDNYLEGGLSKPDLYRLALQFLQNRPLAICHFLKELYLIQRKGGWPLDLKPENLIIKRQGEKVLVTNIDLSGVLSDDEVDNLEITPNILGDDISKVLIEAKESDDPETQQTINLYRQSIMVHLFMLAINGMFFDRKSCYAALPENRGRPVELNFPSQYSFSPEDRMLEQVSALAKFRLPRLQFDGKGGVFLKVGDLDRLSPEKFQAFFLSTLVTLSDTLMNVVSRPIAAEEKKEEEETKSSSLVGSRARFWQKKEESKEAPFIAAPRYGAAV